MFLWLFFFFATSFGTSVCVLLCYAFPFMNILLLPSSTMVSSFLYYILDTESSSFLVLVLFLLLYLFFYTPHTTLFLADITPHVFYLSFKKKPLSSIFMDLNSLAFIFPIVYIGYYYHLCNPFSLKQEHILQRDTLLLTVLLYLFLYRTYWPLFLLYLLQSSHIYCLFYFPFLFLCYYVWTLPFAVPNSLVSKALYFFLHSFLLFYFYFTFYFTLHYPSCQYPIFILGFFFFFLLLFFLCSVVMDQMSELSTTSIFSFF